MKVQLAIYRKLEGLTEDEIKYFRENDVERVFEIGDAVYVDGDQARNYEYTELVMEKTVGFALCDPNSLEILREFGHFAEAEFARQNAKVTFSIDLPAEEDDVLGADFATV